MRSLIKVLAFLLIPAVAWCQSGPGVSPGTGGLSPGSAMLNKGGPPTGAAGNDLFGMYPNPGVGRVNGITPGGSCPAGQFVSALSSSAVPNCTTPTSSSGAPLVNPAGGQNNYAPIASPAFTGGTTLTNNQNNSTIAAMTNTDPGGSSATSFQFNNGATTDSFGLTGSGYTAGGATLLGNSMFFYNAATNGIEFWNNSSGPTSFWNGSTKIGQFTGTGLDTIALTIGGIPLGGNCTAGQFVSSVSASGVPSCATPTFNGAPLVNPANGQNNYAPLASPSFTGTAVIPTLNLTNSTNTAVLFGVVGTPNASIVSVGTNNMNLAAGAHYTTASGWIADATSASFVNGGNGAISVYGKTGLTVGSAFSPVQIVGIDASGFNLLSGSARAPAFIGNGTPSFTGGTAAGSNQPTSTTGEITATGSSITITTGSNCGTRNVVGMILDASASTMAQLTARSATAISFNATSGHVYDYAALSCG